MWAKYGKIRDDAICVLNVIAGMPLQCDQSSNPEATDLLPNIMTIYLETVNSAVSFESMEMIITIVSISIRLVVI